MAPVTLDFNTGVMSTDASSAVWAVVRVVAGIAVAAVSAFAAFLLLFIGITNTTGCFFECTDPNLLIGIPSLLGAVAVASLGVTSFVWGFGVNNRRTLLYVFGLTGAGIVLLGTWIALMGPAL